MFYGRRLFKAVTFFVVGDIIALICPMLFLILAFICAIAIFGVIALFRFEKYYHLQKYFAFFVLGLLLGGLFNNVILEPFNAYENSRTEISGYVTEVDNFGGSITIRVKNKELSPFRFSAKLYGEDDLIENIEKGDMIKVIVDCGKISQKNYLIADRCYIQGKIISYIPTDVEIGIFDSFYLKTRSIISKGLHHGLGDTDEYALADGILVGDQTKISIGLKQAFKNTGTSHFLSISGLHFSLLVAMTFFVILRVTGNERAACIISVILIALYMPIPSFTPPVVRSAFISLFLFFTKLTKIKSDTVTSMSLSLLIILIFNPAAILSIGLQLSYCATFGIIYAKIVSPEIELENRHGSTSQKIRRFILSGFKVSTLALIFTTPITILAFESFSVFSPLFNIVLSPLFTIVLFCSILIACISILFPLLSQYAIYILEIPLKLFNFLIKVFGSFSFVKVNTDGKLVILLSYLLILAIFLAILTHERPREKDGKVFLFITWGAVVVASLLGI